MESLVSIPHRMRMLAALWASLVVLTPWPSWAQSTPFVGEIRWVAFDFAPQGWARCNGQLLSIPQNAALFSVLGTAYGGNGITTFALPDLRGRAPLHMGTGYAWGQKGGEEMHTLTLAELPAHTHAVQADGREATQANPSQSNHLGKTSAGTSAYGSTPTTNLATTSVTSEGSGFPHDNMKPYIALTCIIALTGLYPSQN
jgi:microcystin-dependent protein